MVHKFDFSVNALKEHGDCFFFTFQIRFVMSLVNFTYYVKQISGNFLLIFVFQNEVGKYFAL